MNISVFISIAHFKITSLFTDHRLHLRNGGIQAVLCGILNISKRQKYFPQPQKQKARVKCAQHNYQHRYLSLVWERSFASLVGVLFHIRVCFLHHRSRLVPGLLKNEGGLISFGRDQQNLQAFQPLRQDL